MSAVPPVLVLLDLPGIRDEVEAVREEAGRLRFHEALRRRIPEAAAESRVRGAAASARLDGARLPDDVVRQYVVGARPWPQLLDPTERVARGAVRATVEAEHLVRRLRAQPRLVLARLHTVAAADLAGPDDLGRPRTADGCGELVDAGPAPSAAEARARLDGVVRLLSDTSVPGPLAGAVAHAEIATARPFAVGNGVVARAVERLLLVASAADPSGVGVPEAGYEAAGVGYVGALAAWAEAARQDLADGPPLDGRALWLRTALTAQRRGVAEGVRVADAVRRGRLEG